jgi:acyl-CoA reductase-like NAD-dependent aldehyde dehydrogenase
MLLLGCQVWNDKLIMSYCPADGRVLGNGIKPATIEDVNVAVRAAKAAQPEWAKTSFAERRKVLRTLLKYVSLQIRYIRLWE